MAVIAVCALSVPMRIMQVKADRSRKIVSFYDEWKTNGKPVEVKIVKVENIPVYSQFTVKITDGQMAQGYVTRAIKNALKEGQEVFDADKSVVYGKLARVGQEMDINTGMFLVEVRFTRQMEPERLLVVTCLTETLKNALALPNEVLDIDSGEYSVWKDELGLAKKYKVKIGSRNGYGAIITEGLQTGDKVIYSGQSVLSDNDRLREIMK